MCTVPLVEWLVPVTSCVAYICTYTPYICILNIWHIWHICPIWWAYLFLEHIWPITCAVEVAVGSVLVYLFKNGASICPFSKLSMWAVFRILQPYMILIYVKYVYSNPWRIADIRKPTHTDLYIQWDSHQTISSKYSVIDTIHHRAKTICSSPELLQQEEDHLYRV